jgi:hypothetical protein
MSGSAEQEPTFSLFAKPCGQMAKLQSPSSSNRILLRQSKGHTQSLSVKQPSSGAGRDGEVGLLGRVERIFCIDLPQIAREYSSVWNATISDESMEGDDAIPEDVLSTIKAEIVSLLQAMGEIDYGWRLTALDEILTWMKMDTIIINLTMETELVDYFEVTAASHSSTGEISSRPGFRSFELHHLLFDYILPWWEGASENPASRFPRTSALIQKLLDNPGTKDLGETKLDQLKEGISAGKKEIMKVYSTLMTAPMIFTALSDPLRGPSILRAVIEIIRESETELADVDDDEWAEMNSEEDSLDLVFYNILEPQAEDVMHWFQQIGLGKAVVRKELQELSNENYDSTSRSVESSTRLHEFYESYPTIFKAL